MGSIFGSFFAATNWALVNNSPLLRKRSICDSCGSQIPVWSLVPIFSYLFLKGQCHYCGRKIPLFHFIMEILPAATAVVFVHQDGLDYLVICHIILSTAIISACVIDFIYRRLPDIISIGCLSLLPAELLLNPALSLKDSIIGYLAGGALPLFLAMLFKLLRHKEGMGLGDVKLYALAGAFLGWQKLPFLFLFSALCGLLIFLVLAPLLKKEIFCFRLPFGPCIGAVFIILLLFPSLPTRFYSLWSACI